MTWLETRIPPPLVMLLCAGIGWLGSRLWPEAVLPLPMRALMSGGVIGIGVALNLLPKLAFQRARTTVNPLRPSASSALVTRGMYRYTRNPMYLGQLLQLLAWAFWLENLATFAFLPAFVAWMTRFQIIPEERILGIKFGNDYADYLNRVRRWI